MEEKREEKEGKVGRRGGNSWFREREREEGRNCPLQTRSQTASDQGVKQSPNAFQPMDEMYADM